ncbi:carboxypeptidase-like regulatory domain-containing protein, partial [Acinetobacter baumannii]
YTFTTVPAGTYTVKVNHAGFKSFARTDVPVTINNVTRVDVTLEIGTVTETVTVTTDTAQLQTDTAEVKGELNNRAGESARATRQ